MHKAVRSKELIMERISEIDYLCNDDWNTIIPDDLDSEFFSSFPAQLNFLRRLRELKIADLCYILRISTKTYYKLLPILEKGHVKDENADEAEPNIGRPPNVTNEEELELLKQLEIQQCNGDCMSPYEARCWLEDHIKEKGRDVQLDRFWWYRFKRKHQDHFNVMKTHSLESCRADVSTDDINNHFQKFNSLITTPRAPQLILNMDESGFSQRPNKNATKNCICIKSCKVPPTFRDDRDGNHISIVASVTLSGRPLKPLLLSTTEKPPKEVTDSILGDDFLWFKTKKGYLNEAAMIYWIEQVLLPYVNHMKHFFPPDSVRPLLIFDGLKAHLTENVTRMFSENSIDILTLPPHASHLLQCLDLSFFGVMKRQFRITQSYLFRRDQKSARKIEKILKSFHTASFPSVILAGWKESGIDFTIKNGKIISLSLNKNRVMTKLLKQ